MQLEFDSPEEMQAHKKRRTIAGGVGSLAGGAIGGLVGSRLVKGPAGAIVGGSVGAALGNVPGRLAADVAYDAPHRAGHAMHSTVHRLDAAGGSGMRIASATPTATEFVEFAQQHEIGQPRDPKRPDGMDRRYGDPSWGPAAPLDGGEAQVAGVGMGLPAYGGV